MADYIHNAFIRAGTQFQSLFIALIPLPTGDAPQTQVEGTEPPGRGGNALFDALFGQRPGPDGGTHENAQSDGHTPEREAIAMPSTSEQFAGTTHQYYQQRQQTLQDALFR